MGVHEGTSSSKIWHGPWTKEAIPRYWVQGIKNSADIAPKGNVQVSDCGPNSIWHVGFPWHTKSLEQILADGDLTLALDLYKTLTKEKKMKSKENNTHSWVEVEFNSLMPRKYSF